MRIALAHSHPDTFGGGERALLEVATRLAARHEVRLVLGRFDPDATYAGLARYPRHCLPRWRWPLATLDDDVVVANSFGANLLALRNPGRVVCWVHTLRSVYLQTGARRRPTLLARLWLDRLAIRRAARVVANSHFTASRMPALYGRAADAVVHPGVDGAAFHRARAGEGGYAVTVGRVSPEKGLERLLRLWHNLPDVQLRIVGDGDPTYLARLRAVAPANVTWLGRVSGADLVATYADAALAVFAPHAEEFGIAIVEAMASGLPVVAWREGGPTETVEEGVSGYLEDRPDAFAARVRALWADPPLRERMGAAGRQRAAAFSWDRAAERLERVCLEVASSRGLRR